MKWKDVLVGGCVAVGFSVNSVTILIFPNRRVCAIRLAQVQREDGLVPRGIRRWGLRRLLAG